MKNKLWSLIIVTLIYLIAALCGGLVLYYGTEKMHALLLVFLADVAATFIVFIASLILKNASVYDPYWSAAPPLLVIGFYYVLGAAFDPIHLIVLIPLTFWAVRLTCNWAIGFDNMRWQDWRYVRYKDKFPRVYPLINFFGIMLIPTIFVFVAMIPLYFLISGDVNIIALTAGGAIVLFAFCYQTVADQQLRKFRRAAGNKGKVMERGLWSLSRHPNYFAEMTVWLGVFVSSIPNILWFTPIGFLGMVFLFNVISVPLMKGHMLSRYEGYRAYMEAVPNRFIPVRVKRR